MFRLGMILLAGVLAPAVVRAQTPPPDLTSNPAAERRALNPELPTLFIAGDSTAARNSGQPHQGWGEPFAAFFDSSKINVANRARGGRSSRTFITEGLWDQLLADLKPGDIVLIQFGHNDGGAINEEPPGSTRPLRARGSLPGLGEESQAIVNALTKQPETVRTFGWYMRKMIADTRAKGATPILLSLTVRNLWQDGEVERGSGDYRRWTAELARQEKVPYVDLTRILADAYQVMGEDAVKAYFPTDYAHTSPDGARFTAESVVAGLKGLRGGPELDGFWSEAGQAVKPDQIGWLNLPEPADPALPSIVLIGDSTVRNGRGDGSNGEWGWGEPLAERFDPAAVNVVNRAIGGLSSRTFLTQGHWARAHTLLKPGDVLLIQFGHNDSSPVNDSSRARGTLPGVGQETEMIDNQLTHEREEVGTYGSYLRHYIREAKEAGVTPVVLSPVPRKKWEDGRVVRPANSYPQWARQVAEAEGVPFVDLHERVAARYDKLGADQVDALFADAHTHTSRAGAELNADVVAAALRELDEPSIQRVVGRSAKPRDEDR